MKIGNKSIQGIYKYSETCIPEINDFVLYDNYLWVCKADAPQHAPSMDYPLEWSPYMSPDMIGIDEVTSILKSDDAQWPEKAVQAKALPAVIDSVFNGLTGKGIIRDGMVTLSNIISDIDHPYGIYPFSRSAEDVKGLVSLTPENKDIPVFVKKYTYTTAAMSLTNGLSTYVLLEVCDYLDGTMWYKLYTPGSTKNLMAWKLVSPGLSMKNTIETLVNQYRSRLRELTGIDSIIRDNFRFTKLTFPETPGSELTKSIEIGSNLSRSNGSSTEFPRLPEGTSLDYTVVMMVKEDRTGIWRSESVTIPGSTSMEVYVNFTGLPEPLTLGINVVEQDRLYFSLQGIPSGYTGKIASVYYQDFYEH